MNYRHAYHAGNFADVLKHLVLVRILAYLKLKPQPFRIIDSHAGAGIYDLSGIEAGKTGEWRDGIARVIDHTFTTEASGVLAPYLDAIRQCNRSRGEAGLRFYPGSPMIADLLRRPGDTLVANELHPEDRALLKQALRRAPDSKVMALDGWAALKAFLPPKERRGLVIIDPPFEAPDEFDRLALGLDAARKRFANGTYLVWYPVKNTAAADRFLASARASPDTKFVDCRLRICEPFPGLGLTETGLLVINPPYTLAADLALVLPELTAVLAEQPTATFSLRHA
jgi:23S rRNA (adenine2030-N6)-methyltransferase